MKKTAIVCLGLVAAFMLAGPYSLVSICPAGDDCYVVTVGEVGR
ncbi:MAG: hypothetical protein PHP59_04050 [Methanofollis sp.]|nr:hypothetical protein [Methanofollis sp.]MDD4254530.1 hypothetical protein [Methanofollis sp.]